MGFDHDAGMFVSCSDRVDSQYGQESQRRPVTHCQAVSNIAGSDGCCIQCDTFWPAVHETPAVVAQDQGVLPEGKPALHDHGHTAMPTCLGHVEETLVLVSGPGFGSSLSLRNASDRRIPDRLGNCHEWPPCPRSVEWSPSHVAHQLPGDAGRVSSTQTLSPRPKKSPCDPRPGEWRLHPEVVKQSFWPGTGESVCDSSDITLSPMVLSDSSSSNGAGCYGTDVAGASSVRLSLDHSAPGSSRESAPGWGPSIAKTPFWPGRV